MEDNVNNNKEILEDSDMLDMRGLVHVLSCGCAIVLAFIGVCIGKMVLLWIAMGLVGVVIAWYLAVLPWLFK